jgi:hypothetical protein
MFLQFPFVSGQSGVCETAIQIGEDNMAVEEIRVSRAYLDDLNREIAALKLQVAQLKQELAARAARKSG